MPQEKPAPSVIIVDDEPLVLEGFTEILKRAGYEVHAFDCPTKASLELSDEMVRNASCFVVDLEMPEMTGLEFFNAMEQASCPAIFISGIASLSDEDLSKHPNSSFLKKPFSSKDLLAAIENKIHPQ